MMDSLRDILTRDPLPISRHRARLLPLSGAVRELILEVWLRRLEDSGFMGGNGKSKPYKYAPTVHIPPRLRAAYERVKARVPTSYTHEEMGFLLRDLLRIVDGGGGENDLKAFLRKELL